MEDKMGPIYDSKEDWKMPENIRKTLETQHRVKETERLVNLEMRKLAEQEILKEAEKLSRKSRQQPESQVDLSKTTKNLSFLASSIRENEEAVMEEGKDESQSKLEDRVEEIKQE